MYQFQAPVKTRLCTIDG